MNTARLGICPGEQLIAEGHKVDLAPALGDTDEPLSGLGLDMPMMWHEKSSAGAQIQNYYGTTLVDKPKPTADKDVQLARIESQREIDKLGPRTTQGVTQQTRQYATWLQSARMNRDTFMAGRCFVTQEAGQRLAGLPA